MKLKLTTAQQELYQNYQLNGATLDGNTLADAEPFACAVFGAK